MEKNRQKERKKNRQIEEGEGAERLTKELDREIHIFDIQINKKNRYIYRKIGRQIEIQLYRYVDLQIYSYRDRDNFAYSVS